jgi:hypothetical protein
MNEKTEVTERRQVNFELFFQTIMLHETYINHDLTKDFFKFDYDYEQEKKSNKLTVYYLDKEKSKFLIDIGYETTTQIILKEINKNWDIRDIDSFRVCFLSEKYGEKVLDLYECPWQVQENFEASKASFMQRFVGHSVTSKPRNNTLRFFEPKNKYAFYVRRFIFHPEDYTLAFRIPIEELKRRFYQ